MARKRFEISEQQDRELQRAFVNARDGATGTRYQAVRLYGQGYKVEAICQITGCARVSLMEWCRKFRDQGGSGLVDHRGGRQRAKLRWEQVMELSEKLHSYTPSALFGPDTHTASGQHWTVEDLARAVQQGYGVTWKDRASYHTLLAHCGFSYQRTEKVYKSRRERAVLDFEERAEKN